MRQHHSDPTTDQPTAQLSAVVGTLVAIGLAVLVGIFGPQLSDRGLATPGVPLGAVVEALGDLHRTGGPGGTDPIALKERLQRLVDPPIEVPAIAGGENGPWTLESFQDGALPRLSDAGEMVVARFRHEEPHGYRFLGLAAITDSGTLTRFDQFGRSRPLQDGEILRFSPEETASGVSVLVLVNGPVVWVVHADDPDDLEMVLEQLRPDESLEPPSAPDFES